MRAFEACRYLSEEIGPRWIGSDGEKRAGDWLERELGELGWDVRRLWFDCPAWDYSSTSLAVGGEPVDAGAQMFSPACDVEADLARIQPDGRGGFSGDAAGKLALLKEEETGGVLARSALARALKAEGALAAIIVSDLPETWSTKLFRDPEAGLSSVAVSRRAGGTLLEKAGSRARLTIDARPREGKTSNVIAEKGPADARVLIVGAHHEAAPYSPGAHDNAAGTGVLLELADRFSSVETPARLRLCAFGGHEYGGTDCNGFGSKSYVRAYPQELERVELVLNMDGLGAAGSHPCLVVYGGDELSSRVEAFAAGEPDVDVGRGSGGGADVGAFRETGIECVWLRSEGGAGKEYARSAYHSPLDDMRWVNEAALERQAELAFGLLSELMRNG